MLLAQTGDGIARVGPEGLQLLDAPGRSLEDFIVEGRLAEVAGLRVRKEISRRQATFAPPVRRPGKIVVIGLNYRDHAAETGSPLPALPRFHLIPGSAVTSPDTNVHLPESAPERVDYEGELAVVIGRDGRDIPERDAWDFVAGGTVANDLSARDVQAGDNPALAMASPALAKGFDGFKPLGPALLTADELRLHDALDITTEVNGVVRQRSSTAELIFPVPQLLAYVSSFLTLEAGDVILTGTPGGTGIADGRFLAAGDVVSVTLDRIGTLTSTIAPPNAGLRQEES
ncbi:fumarylacetoacetate hydrolase family protein [Streptomyces sp. NPDC093544]|jgi:2-keto-4-pentenoate hydratase/2-oxohepta-3-ene-1,7-dioic acid hydratase in catechol pathway|uniref:fumarylacetoacetate hydrolase family protein n=1 Tax=Streptomyces sp. NPDC093544 TaxID=3155200 RepID=UPI003444942F